MTDRVFKDGDLIIAIHAEIGDPRIRRIEDVYIKNGQLNWNQLHAWPLDKIFLVLGVEEPIENLRYPDIEIINIKKYE